MSTGQDILAPERYTPEAWSALSLSVAMAALTNWPRIQASHLLLALLQRDPGFIDGTLRKHLRGLRAATLVDALRGQLTIKSEADSMQAGEFAEDAVPRPSDLDESAWAVLRSPVTAPVSFDALAHAALRTPDEVTVDVLWRYSHVKPEELAAAAQALPIRAALASPIAVVDLIRNGYVDLSVFDALMQKVLSLLGPLAQERPLLETDFLRMLLETEGSALRDLLRQNDRLTAVLDRLKPGEASKKVAARSAPIPADRLGRMMSRVLADAACLVADTHVALISEGVYLRAHWNRVNQADGNVFARTDIPIQDFFALCQPAAKVAVPVVSTATRSVDVWEIVQIEVKPGEAVTAESKSLRWSAFGPIATAALRSLVPISRQRALLDVDLLLALLRQPQSRLLEALHVMIPSVPELRTSLEQFAGSAAPASTVQGVAQQLLEERLGRMLKLVVRDSAQAAHDEGCPVISECHLVRSHIARISSSSGNLYERLGIPVDRLREYLSRYSTDREPEQAKHTGLVANIGEYLNARVINQPHAVERATKALTRMRSGLGEPGQVLGKFLFLGATGVGKTELARAMADVAFGTENGVREAHIIRIDCGNFKNEWDIVQLIGAAQGLKGYGEGQLTNGLRDKPRSVILFDEAEKAFKGIWQSLLPLFDEGLVRDPAGQVFDATQCILVATSNKGYKEAIDATNAWSQDWEMVRERVENSVWNSLGDYFSPEFLGRFGRPNVIFFNHFSERDYRAIINLQLHRIVEEMKGRGIALNFDTAVAEAITREAWKDRQEGARPVRRLITEHIRDRMIAERTEDPGRSAFHFFVNEVGEIDVRAGG